jgi:flagellar protein FlaG
MINMISQLVPQPVAGTGPPLTADRKLPEAVAAGEKSPEKAHPEVQGGSNKAPAEELTGALNQLNGYMEEMHRSLRFSIDDDSGRTVVRVVDTENEEVIRQIPSEEMLALIRHFNEVTGNLFDAVA